MRLDYAAAMARLPQALTTMEIKDLSARQKQALLDLLIIGMYADHNLASAEDARLRSILDKFPFPTDYERQMYSDASFTRARQRAGSPEAIRAYVAELAAQFPTSGERQGVYELLDGLMTADGKITSEESQLLAAVRAVFQLS